MATYTTSQTLSPIQGGSLNPRTIYSYELEDEQGASVPKSDTKTGNTGFMDKLLIGTRTREIIGYEGISSIGALVNQSAEDLSRRYELLKEYGVGTRERNVALDDFILESRQTGTRTKPIRSGVGTFGIQYQQTIVQNGDKRIRRWPRDWHGDNMKN